MQKRAGLLFLSLDQRRVLLILEKDKWTVPTFMRSGSLIEDSKEALNDFANGKLVPIELYLSQDKGFEYGTYICLVSKEFIPTAVKTFCWANLYELPKNLHNGLRNTLNNSLIRTKIETILELEDVTS
jgi:hypothetical protein